MPRRVLAVLDRLTELLAGTVLSALLVCVTLGIVTRALNDPLIWTDEAARFLMTWLAAFGWMLVSRKRAHIRIRFFQDKLPRAGWLATEAAIQSAMLLFGLLVAVFAVGLVQRNWELEATSMPLSMAWLYLPLIPAGGIMASQGALELWLHVTGRRSLHPDQPEGQGAIH